MTTLLICLCLHFIADFILQSREMGKNKSSSYKWLGLHLLIQFLVFLPIGLKFSLCNAIIHGIIDKNIWNLYKFSAYLRIKKMVEPLYYSEENKKHLFEKFGKEWKYWEDHLFYTTIGFDQLLHIGTIVMLLEYLK